MTLPRRLWTPLAVSALLGALWFGERALCSCGGPSAPAGAEAVVAEPAGPADLSDPSWIRTPSAAGTYLFVWRPEPAPITRNQDFALELWILRDGEPLQPASLDVTAWMPEHGHGMLRTVRPEARPDGSYRVENLLLHMRGHWLVVFDVLDGTRSERAEHALEL